MNGSDAPVTGQSICSLASFYRIGLAYGSDTITVQELHEMTGSYLLIEQLLNPDMLYEVSIAPELFGLRVPKYLFVPLLDNAIAHGIKALPGGVVCVSLERCVPGYGGQRLLRPAESDDAASNLLQDHKRPAYPHEGRRGNRSLF